MEELDEYKEKIATFKNNVNQIKYGSIASGYQTALQVVDDVVLKNYIGNLSSMPVVPLSKDVLANNIRDNVLFFKITEMVYEKEEFATYKFESVFNSLATTESAVFIIIDSDGIKTNFYMGVRSLDSDRTTSSLRDTVENAMKGQFPGIKTQDYTIESMQNIISGFKKNSTWSYCNKSATKAWVNAQAFKNYLINSGRGSYIAKGNYCETYKAAFNLRPGDIVAYEKKGRITHVSTVTGLDSKGYPLVTCHNTDRMLVPYDLGWSNSNIKFHLIDVHY